MSGQILETMRAVVLTRRLAEHGLGPRGGAVYPLTRIRDALIAQDAGTVDGKIVVVVDS